MSKIQDYIAKQEEAIKKIEERKRLGSILSKSMEILDFYSDARLKIYNNQTDIEKDPVYKKISRIRKYTLGNPDSYLFEEIALYMEKLQNRMEVRGMNGEEYGHLYKTPIKRLLKDWSEQFELLRELANKQ